MDNDDCGGFSLVEVVLALAIFVFAIIPIIGLLSIGLNVNRESEDETFATSVMSVVVRDRMASPYSQISGIYKIAALTPAMVSSTNALYLNDDYSLVTQAQALYKVDYVLVPSGTASSEPYLMRCRVSWPAASLSPRGFVESVAAIPQATPVVSPSPSP